MTTLDPGASEVLTHGLEARPRSTALRASRPAPSMTDGLEVLVQLVMAAITTWPWSGVKAAPPSAAAAAAGGVGGSMAGKASALASPGPLRLPLLALSQPPDLAAELAPGLAF